MHTHKKKDWKYTEMPSVPRLPNRWRQWEFCRRKRSQEVLMHTVVTSRKSVKPTFTLASLSSKVSSNTGLAGCFNLGKVNLPNKCQRSYFFEEKKKYILVRVKISRNRCFPLLTSFAFSTPANVYRIVCVCVCVFFSFSPFFLFGALTDIYWCFLLKPQNIYGLYSVRNACRRLPWLETEGRTQKCVGFAQNFCRTKKWKSSTKRSEVLGRSFWELRSGFPNLLEFFFFWGVKRKRRRCSSGSSSERRVLVRSSPSERSKQKQQKKTPRWVVTQTTRKLRMGGGRKRKNGERARGWYRLRGGCRIVCESLHPRRTVFLLQEEPDFGWDNSVSLFLRRLAEWRACTMSRLEKNKKATLLFFICF